MARCRYIVLWTSAVSGSARSCGYPDKFTADKDARALTKEGAKNVRVIPYR